MTKNPNTQVEFGIGLLGASSFNQFGGQHDLPN